MLQSFARAYPPLDEKSRYWIVADTGEHFFLWWAYVPETHTKEQEEEIMSLGMDLIIMGNEMDREGIKKTFLYGHALSSFLFFRHGHSFLFYLS